MAAKPSRNKFGTGILGITHSLVEERITTCPAIREDILLLKRMIYFVDWVKLDIEIN